VFLVVGRGKKCGKEEESLEKNSRGQANAKKKMRGAGEEGKYEAPPGAKKKQG